MNKMILSGNLANIVTKKHLNNDMCVAWQDNSGNTKSKHYIIIKRLEVLNNKTQQSSQTSPTFKSTKP
ncbi:hypothetical protein NHP164001_19220 [Helicobacter trogontum]|uniref:Single-stranded DNA-binding protein n=1 Tax=Helicobacter trogontum TaxID=50960 RepID=A0ABQ0D6B6_9HELI|nr:hypothetical protein [Helicobacter trogontum]